ncbi:hypothetical protein L228DRAFT_27301 [Xylona heveae TC161]|uniref:EXS domain-containing protein n=1 Tax=Xylona heveae (strain CBS 132557 / TC161) TaxID=1328760 RepID=A0A165AFZ7_XYLHT|nr:hypothetical protein L228DRAFT_27301 [Xylona heveae TC161]KZF20412.1 hypothetical protein L228DRAFT_27301 [Xylona heveae TC161]
MVIDPLLRFNWVFYAIFSDEVQHSATLSFFISLSEVFRRGMWALFRVENEHCTNVGRFRASRDVPLPYDIPTPSTSDLEAERNGVTQQPVPAGAAGPDRKRPTSKRRRSLIHAEPVPISTTATGADIEAQTATTPKLPPPTPSGMLRLRRTRTPSSPGTAAAGSPRTLRGLARVGTLLAEAHAQDFERKRRPEVASEQDHEDLRDPENLHHMPSSDEEDEDGYEDPGVDDVDNSRELANAERLLRRTSGEPGRTLHGTDDGERNDDRNERQDGNKGNEHRNLHYE